MTDEELNKIKKAVNGRSFFDKPSITDVIKILSFLGAIVFFIFGLRSDVSDNTKDIGYLKEQEKRIEQKTCDELNELQKQLEKLEDKIDKKNDEIQKDIKRLLHRR